MSIADRGPGGELRLAAPPGRATRSLGELAGSCDTRYTNKKKTNNDILFNFKNLTRKARSSSRWNFSSGSLSAVELAVSLRFWVGQVDAEKLAQRSSVAAWGLTCGTKCPWTIWTRQAVSRSIRYILFSRQQHNELGGDTRISPHKTRNRIK